jgi:hypothetical protein
MQYLPYKIYDSRISIRCIYAGDVNLLVERDAKLWLG